MAQDSAPTSQAMRRELAPREFHATRSARQAGIPGSGGRRSMASSRTRSGDRELTIAQCTSRPRKRRRRSRTRCPLDFAGASYWVLLARASTSGQRETCSKDTRVRRPVPVAGSANSTGCAIAKREGTSSSDFAFSRSRRDMWRHIRFRLCIFSKWAGDVRYPRLGHDRTCPAPSRSQQDPQIASPCGRRRSPSHARPPGSRTAVHKRRDATRCSFR
jgi:hypothetical protein